MRSTARDDGAGGGAGRRLRRHAGCSHARNMGGRRRRARSASPAARATAGDLKWLSYVASYDVSEIKLARLAQARSNMGLVKEFGAVKLARHQRSFQSGRGAGRAVQHAHCLPQATATGEEQFRSLNHIGDAQFDRRFLSLQVQLHSAAAKAAAAAMGQAPVGESRNWASRAWTRWHRDEVWAGQLHQQVLVRPRRGTADRRSRRLKIAHPWASAPYFWGIAASAALCRPSNDLPLA